ncbi:MAG: hypothetical protein KDB62_04995 [Solirubrobacterales bacterium]|nr:hypothetical protein [Solirubrobacterales bacterium]
MSDLKINGYTVGQAPNPPLWLALVGLVVSLLAPDGSLLYGIARAALVVGLAVWAWWELFDGANGFRRGLGAAGLVIVTVLLVDTFS